MEKNTKGVGLWNLEVAILDSDALFVLEKKFPSKMVNGVQVDNFTNFQLIQKNMNLFESMIIMMVHGIFFQLVG